MPQSTGSGGTYWVDNVNGSDANSGSSGAPWRTINKALASVPLSGSIIKVRPGTFYSTGTNYAIIFNRKANVENPITVKAEVPGTVKIRNGNLSGYGLGGWIVRASGLRVEGFDISITGTRTNISVNHMLIENSDRIEFFHNTFHESGTFQVRGGMTDGEHSDDVWLLSNTFRPSGTDVFAQAAGNSHTSDTYAGSKGSHYVYAGQMGDDSSFDYRSGSERFVVANNLFVGTASGRHVELGPQARNSYVVNNTFYGNHAGQVIGWNTGAAYAGEGVVLFANTSSAVPGATRNNMIANNLFVSLSGHAVYGSGPSESGNVVQRNMSFEVLNALGYNGSATDDYAQNYGSSILFGEGLGNYSRADPKFVAPLSYNYELQSTSPAIGKSDPAYTLPFDHEGRPRDVAPDLGALERQPTVDPDPAAPDPDPVDPVEPVAPKIATSPSLSFQALIGTYATCHRGTWTGTGPISYTYRWYRQRAGVTSRITSGTSYRYKISKYDFGARLACTVTATSSAGATTWHSPFGRRILR
jgi:hypothetical protein